MEPRKSLLKLKTKTPAFTLVETIIALVLVVTALVLLTNFFNNSQKELRDMHRADRFQVTCALATLQSSELDLHYLPQKGQQLIFYSPSKDMNYSLEINGKRLVMRGESQGFMPLLYNVDAGSLSFKAPKLDLKLTIHGVTYHEQVTYSPFEKEQTNEKKNVR